MGDPNQFFTLFFSASIQEQPLPPVPMLQPKEPIYEELCQDTLLSRRRFKSNIDLHEPHELSQPVMMRRKSAENEFTGGRQDFPMTVRVNFGVSSSTTGNGNTEEEEEFLKPISGGGSAGQLASGTAQVSISPTFYNQLFPTKVFCAAFLDLHFGLVIFLLKENWCKSCS